MAGRVTEESPQEHHDHLIDAKSGPSSNSTLTRSRSCRSRSRAKLGYRLVDHRLELYGVPLTEDEKK